MNEKTSKLEILHAKIDVFDKLLQNLLHLCAANNVKVPDHLIVIIEALYNKKMVRENGNESEKKEIN
jgi:deoxyadenosine/deoxycytidine kinase